MGNSVCKGYIVRKVLMGVRIENSQGVRVRMIWENQL